MVAESLTELNSRIEAAAQRAGRDPGEIRLVVVTKAATDAQVTAAYEAGHRDFGENRVKALVARAADALEALLDALGPHTVTRDAFLARCGLRGV